MAKSTNITANKIITIIQLLFLISSIASYIVVCTYMAINNIMVLTNDNNNGYVCM